MLMCIQNLVQLCPFILKIWIKNQILTSMKGLYSVGANLRKKTLHNLNIDLVKDNVYKKLDLNLYFRSQDREQKTKF